MNVEWIPLYVARRYLTPESATGNSEAVAKEIFKKGSKIAASVISTVKDVTGLLGPLTGDFTGMTSLFGNMASGFAEALSMRSLRGLQTFRDVLLGHPSHPLPKGTAISNDGSVDPDIFDELSALLERIDAILDRVVLSKNPTNVWKKNYLRKRDVPIPEDLKSSVYVSLENLVRNSSIPVYQNPSVSVPACAGPSVPSGRSSAVFPLSAAPTR